MALLGHLPWSRVPAGPLVLVPLGSTEQHGPHLPLETDTVIATASAEDAAGRLRADAADRPVLVAPAIAYGSSGEHQHFPGTVSIGADALQFQLIELVRSLSAWAARIVVVNGHGGNDTGLATAFSLLLREGHDAAWVSCQTASQDAHAGYTETSLMLHLVPHLVDMAHAQPGNVTPLAELMPSLVGRGVRAVSATGVLGDPTGANQAAGRVILERVVDEIVARIAHGAADGFGCLRSPAHSLPQP